jgi:DnaJ like chaperone protein
MLIIVLIGASLGYLVGGPLGLLVGGGLGWWLAARLRRSMLGRVVASQAQFLASTFAVMGCLCKADGRVTQDELDASRRLWDRLRLNEAQRAKARADFTRGKSEDFDLDAELAAVRGFTQGQTALRQVFLQVQLSAIAADGVLHPAEHEMMLRVARGLGCSEDEVRQVEAMLHGAAADSPAAHEQSLEEAYQVLGVTPEASNAELKRAYRRLMSQNHPDKLAAKGLPESMREVAQARTSEITNAYERIREARAA